MLKNCSRCNNSFYLSDDDMVVADVSDMESIYSPCLNCDSVESCKRKLLEVLKLNPKTNEGKKSSTSKHVYADDDIPETTHGFKDRTSNIKRLKKR